MANVTLGIIRRFIFGNDHDVGPSKSAFLQVTLDIEFLKLS